MFKIKFPDYSGPREIGKIRLLKWHKDGLRPINELRE